MLVSIIVPVYNVAPYLRRCLDSIVNQTYSQLEIILVDDGSTDESGSICDEYVNIDSRVSVIHQKNAGLSAARNAGLDKANGEYIAFLDSDDWVHLDMYKELVDAAIKTDADIVQCKSCNSYVDGSMSSNMDSRAVKIFSTEEYFIGLYNHEVRFEVWNKLWKRETIGDVRFIVGQVCEDVHFDRLVFMNAKKIVSIDKTLHYYLVARPGSTLTTFKQAKLCIFREFISLICDLKQKYESDTYCKIAALAVSYAIGIYVEARSKKQSEIVIRKIVSAFQDIYSYCKNTQYSTLPMKIFNISPGFFYTVSLIKMIYNGKVKTRNT